MDVNLPTARKTFTVFELVNERLREIYVAHTDGPVFGVVADLRRLAAPPIEHWNFDEVRPVRSIEFGLNEEDARKFVQNYVQGDLPEGWRYLS